jgi:aryl-alcohol dehydrogenase-like predicted oxidoreductase
MEKRRLGRTGHLSTVAIFGSAALSNSTQAEADVVMEQVIRAEVNHIDVAPLYGLAEQRVGPWMPRERSRFFLGCKTRERTRQAAADGLRRSLAVLQTDRFDLLQFHDVTSVAELDQITARGGALEAVVEARRQGLTRFVGLCGHGWRMPTVILEGLRRFDFDTVLFPINRVLMANPDYRREAEEVLRECRARDVGVMIIKSMARESWPGEGQRKTYAATDGQQKKYNTWYRPFDDPQDIQDSANFVLSHDVTGLVTSAEPSIVPLILDACERFSPLSAPQREAIIATAGQYNAVFDENGPIMR